MKALRYEPKVPMRKIAAVFPLPIVLALYACAAGSDADLDENEVISTSDASADDAATTVRKDSGPASPPKDSGASSSGDAGKDSGPGSSSGGSSSGGSSSSSGGGSSAPTCSAGQLIDIGISGINPTQADSCSECLGTGNRCCMDGAGVAPSLCYQF